MCSMWHASVRLLMTLSGRARWQILRAIVQYIDFTIVKAVLVASPGFFKDAFLKYMNEQAHKQGLRVLLDNKGKFVPCHASSGNNVGLLLKVDYMIPRMILNDLCESFLFSQITALASPAR